MTDLQFEKFRTLIYNEFGNTVSDDKRTTLEIKVDKIIRRYHEGKLTVDEYYKKLLEDGKSSATWNYFVDEITVHKTNFFRENDHFKYIESHINEIMDSIPSIHLKKEIRVWCAAASTGEETYSISMMLKYILPAGYTFKFLATDISEKVLNKAVKGEYPDAIKNDIPSDKLQKYFDKTLDGYVVKDELKKLVTFRKFNLCDAFLFKHKFDIIFCRNVMIYFDDELRIKIFKKIYDALSPNGLFILGLSESVGLKNKEFKLIGSSIYKK